MKKYRNYSVHKHIVSYQSEQILNWNRYLMYWLPNKTFLTYIVLRTNYIRYLILKYTYIETVVGTTSIYNSSASEYMKRQVEYSPLQNRRIHLFLSQPQSMGILLSIILVRK